MRKMTAVTVLTLLFVLTISSDAKASFEGEGGVRMMGLGGAFVAISDDAQAVQTNPAGLWFLDRYHLTMSYLRQYVGLSSDHLGYSYFAFASPFAGWGTMGVYNGFLDTGFYRENVFGVSYGFGFGDILSFGVLGKILWKFYAENEDTRQDPFFREFGFNKRNYALDIGMMFKPADVFSFGVIARNLNRPNMSLDPDGKDRIPMSITMGVSSKFLIFTPLVDVELVDQKLAGKYHVRYHFGLEVQVLDSSLALRGGYQNEQITTGMGYTFGSPDGFQMGIEYAFLFPIQSIKSTYGSHNVGVSLAFGEKEKKPKGLRHFEFTYPGRDITSAGVDTLRELEPEMVTSTASPLANTEAFSTFRLDPEEEEVYTYIQITSTIVREDFERVEIRYRVSKHWLTSNKIDTRTLKLLRYDDTTGQTEELESIKVGEDELYLYFIATSGVL